MRARIDEAAEAVARLATVGPAQWLLRLLGAAGVLVAFGIALGWPVRSELGSILFATVLLGVLWQTARPDSDAGIATMGIVLLWAVFGPGQTWASCAAVGALLLVAHACWAVAALAPAHVRLGRGAAWRLLRPQLLVLLLAAVLGAAIVLPLAGTQLGTVGSVAGVIAALALALVLLPRRRD